MQFGNNRIAKHLLFVHSEASGILVSLIVWIFSLCSGTVFAVIAVSFPFSGRLQIEYFAEEIFVKEPAFQRHVTLLAFFDHNNHC